MNIIVDADACPSIELITETAKKYNIPLFLYTDTTHNLINSYATIKVLSKGFQSVDMAIINDIKENDILITQDYGLALLALQRKSKVIHPKGLIYTNNNIDQLLFEKYANSINRKMSNHIKGPKKRTKDDEDKLIENLEKTILENKS